MVLDAIFVNAINDVSQMVHDLTTFTKLYMIYWTVLNTRNFKQLYIKNYYLRKCRLKLVNVPVTIKYSYYIVKKFYHNNVIKLFSSS